MNATDITTEVMNRIRPWLGEGADVERIHYAIERSHDSVISGMKSSDGVMDWCSCGHTRFVHANDATCLGLNTAHEPCRCTGFKDAPRRDEVSLLTIDDMIRQGYSHDQIINERLRRLESKDAPTEWAYEQACNTIERTKKELAESSEGFKVMKAECDAFATTNAKIAAYNTVLRSQRDEALEALRHLQAWSLDTERGPFVPDEIDARVKRVLNQYATEHSR